MEGPLCTVLSPFCWWELEVTETKSCPSGHLSDTVKIQGLAFWFLVSRHCPQERERSSFWGKEKHLKNWLNREACSTWECAQPFFTGQCLRRRAQNLIKGIKRHTLPSASYLTGVVFIAGSSCSWALPTSELYLSEDEARESLKGENLRYSHMKSSPTFSPPPPWGVFESLEHWQR